MAQLKGSGSRFYYGGQEIDVIEFTPCWWDQMDQQVMFVRNRALVVKCEALLNDPASPDGEKAAARAAVARIKEKYSA